MKIAILSPVAWRTPPEGYGPWELVASNLAEGLVKRGYDVTLFATSNSKTKGKLEWIVEKPYAEDPESDAKVSECLHISNLMEKATDFDIIHNHFDFLPLTYSSLINTPMVTTIHGFSSPKIIPVYKKYNDQCHYVSISNSDRSPELDYIANVYNGINTEEFNLQNEKLDYLLFFGRIHPEKGALESIQIARKLNMRLLIAGIIQDKQYFKEKIEPEIDNKFISFVGNLGSLHRDRVLGNAKALLHPILFDEPFGLSVAEAMFCGTPVIAFNRGSMPELIEEGKTGFLVTNVDEAAEKVAQLNQIAPAYCRSYAEQKFSMDKMLDGYLEVYKKILGE